MNQRMNEPIFVPLLFATLSLLDSFFPSGLLLRKNPSARLCMLSFHVTSQVSRYLDGSFQLPLSPETDIWKKNSDRIPIFCTSFWNLFAYLCQWTQRRVSCNTFFLQSIRTFWSSIWSSAVEVPFICIDLCRFSILDVPPSGSENIPKPCCRLMVLRLTTFFCFEYLQRNHVGQMLSMEVCALRCSLQAWLRNV